MLKLTIFFLIILMSINIANAAEIHGDVYDLNFNKLDNVIVEVNSIPKQSLIVKDSGYSFKLSAGNYTIKASYIKNKELISYVEENVLITDSNGDYNIDLILFPYIENDDNLNIDPPIIDNNKNNKLSILIVILSLISVLVVAYLIMSFRKGSKKTENLEETKEELNAIEIKDEALEKAYSIISQEKRVNQKDLRKQLNLSEAKVSLIISQLEAEGRVKKIKKGRGNIIIVNK